MKKILVVLLLLGLIVAFGTTASAADIKMSGSYYVVGVYESNPSLAPGDSAYSHAFFYQRLRLQPVFAIAEGLTFTARADALEKQWGNTNWKGGTDDLTSSRRNQLAAPNQNIQENIEFEQAYVTFNTGIGVFQVGYQNNDDWGTVFGDYSNSRPRIQFTTKAGPMTIGLAYEKVYESDTAGATALNKVDADKDTYSLSGIYNAKGIEAGLLYKYYAYNNARPQGVKTTYNLLSPYAKATFGPVYIEGEASYWFGKYAQYEAPASAQDVDLKAWSAYLMGKMNVGPAYFGALFEYSSGNDLSDDTKQTTDPNGGGKNFNPALILMSDSVKIWTNSGSTAGSPNLSTANPVTSYKYNMVLYNAFAGFNPTPKLNIEACITYAMVDKKALSKTAGIVTEAVSDKLGTEVDVKATYKIYNNLSYMVGAGYLWTGDYFKGASATKEIGNDYILLNQLTVNF
jgi:hypothetical protein